jgi:hypothetical protein
VIRENKVEYKRMRNYAVFQTTASLSSQLRIQYRFLTKSKVRTNETKYLGATFDSHTG